MFKKLHNYLLENYPLAWNLRLHSIIGIIAAVHLLHFLIGYASFSSINKMSYGGASGAFFNANFTMFSIIGSMVIFILWLVRVFRNNALKNFYPISNPQLYAQFLVFFLVCFLNSTYYISFTYGYVAHARQTVSNSVEDRELFRLMQPFVQEGKDQFELTNRCTPSPFPVSKRYKSDDNNNNQPAAVEGIDEGIVEAAASADVVTTNVEDKNTYYYRGSDGKDYTPEQIEAMAGGLTYSFLNYCYYRSYEDEGNRYEYDDTKKATYTAKQLAILKNPEKLKASMVAFTKLCDKYNIRYKIDENEWFRWVYNPPYYPVTYTIKNVYDYSDNLEDISDAALVGNGQNEVNPKGYFVQLSKLEQVINNSASVADFHLESGVVLGFLYLAISMAILLFSFRASTKRVWFITLVGSALLSMVVGAVSAFIFSGFGSSDRGVSMLVFFLMLIAAFLLVHLLSTRKTVSGVALNWFTWSAPFILPIFFGIFTMMEENTRRVMNNGVGMYKSEGIANWLEHNVETFFVLCIIVYLLILWLIVPLYRRWQAMPED